MKKKKLEKSNETAVFDRKELKKKILSDGIGIGIPKEMAEKIAEDVTKEIEKWLKRRSVITDLELNQKIAKETEKINADLSYLYQNRGKII